MSDKTIISLAPMQGVTDHYFRNTFAKYFESFDLSYSPYLRILKGKVKQSLIDDIKPENNLVKIIPQIMTSNVEDFLFLSKIVKDMGYSNINWNLGCPYPMVAKRKMGSGMLAYPELLNSILEEVLPKIEMNLSIKMRTGYETDRDFIKILPILNKFPLSELILHTRFGKQLYKGKANPDVFEEAQKLSRYNLAYNGDIDNVQTFKDLSLRFKETEHWMIGRALIGNPFLAGEIKGKPIVDNKIALFKGFHNDLYSQFEERLSGSGHLLSKMLHLWEFFSNSFTNSHKVYKRIKKAKTIAKYAEATRIIFSEEEIL